ncbi:archaeal heat shock protein Hsp14 [Haloplanus halobius]|uniref:archaeal heat shock protein Hsp14 n=1 Tax=Haloplanus halobius TaxID=2934938 RepID=UPI00200DEC1D|nr:archaeal heat shock protein Hsp14 [Haloplanus sp. XH21]
MQPINYVSEFDDLFERMSRNFGGHSHADADFPVDVLRRDDELVVTADIPGFDSPSVDVSVDDDLLTIRADSETETATDDGAYVRRERRHQSVRRTIRLPATVDEDGASATYRNGVLTVTLPVETETDAVQHIDVE